MVALLDKRQMKVLFATIAEYLETGRPVGSTTISGRAGLSLSPASIRRILNELTVAGHLMQPHTSSGRVPTDAAFRLFVDALRTSDDNITDDVRELLSTKLSDIALGETGMWRNTVRFLSDVSKQAALIITPGFSDTVLRQLRFIPIEPRRLLAVLVTREGLVHNTYLSCDADLTERDLEQVHNYLAQKLTGRTLNEIRFILKNELEDAHRECDEMRRRAAKLGTEAVSSSVQYSSEMLVEGRSNLVAHPDLGDHLTALMSALEQKSAILAILDEAAKADLGPVVIIGSEGGQRFEGCAMITASFGSPEDGGKIGIVGPTRMDYSTMIPMVKIYADSLSRIMEPKKL